MKRSIIRMGCFFIVLLLVLGCWHNIFRFKSTFGIYDLTKFYELEDNTVDILILGSSHSFDAFNTGVLWDEYGMSSFMLGGAEQPLWNTYYYLKEALKTQKPKLVVLEGYCTRFHYEYGYPEQYIFNNFGLKWSKDRIDSLKVSVKKEEWPDYFLEYVQYHSRYTNLDKSDFLPFQGDRPQYEDWKGYELNTKRDYKDSTLDSASITERMELTPYKTEEYYRKVLELAKENDVPIMVVIAPYADITETDQKKFNTASDIASEYDVPFVNCNLIWQEIGMDYTVDTADGGHLNYLGSSKFSKYIGQYIADNYDIPDHRGDEKYISWQKSADYYREAIYDQDLSNSWDTGQVLSMIRSNENYTVFASTDGDCSSAEAYLTSCLYALGVPEDDKNGLWCIERGQVIWQPQEDNGEIYISNGQHDFHLLRNQYEDGSVYADVIIDNEQMKKVDNGLNVVVYDRYTENVVDCFGIDALNDCVLVR